ncbi:MAG: flagellar filament capping protein FliD [Melioribacteraceae bacterium]|nr:flagellar filament capping protein FliD [Melioribacteraceae bacterium]
MPYDLLTTSGINNLVNTYKTTQYQKKLSPLSTKKSYYQAIDNAYSVISSKLSSFFSVVSSLKNSDTSSVFSAMKATSSNSNFVEVSANSSANESVNSIRVNQLAKNDLVLSEDKTSNSSSSLITEAGTHTFVITSGDGSGGTLKSKINVTFDNSDFVNGSISNQTVITKIQNAINSNKAIITSNSVNKNDSISAGSFTLNLNGNNTTISYSAGTYDEVLSSVISQINNLSGVNAEKVNDGENNIKLKITLNDTSKYISVGNDVTGNLISNLNISSNGEKEVGASGFFNASSFSPASGLSQLSITTKNSGYDYRITSLSDETGSLALSSIGLNLGSSRTSFVQNNNGTDTPGFVYSTSQLNAKFEFNGIQVERNSNTISDLISGVTFSLKSAMQNTDSTVAVTVSKDTSVAKSKIEDFVTKFNDLYSYLKTNLSNTKTTRGNLAGDVTATSLRNLLNNIAYKTVDNIDADKINSLSKIGITFNIDSGLSISNSSLLESSIKDKPEQVAALFNSSNGIATSLYNSLTGYLGSTGYIQASRNTLSSSITSINDRITNSQTLIDKQAEALRNNYVKMQMQLVSVLNLQNSFSSYLSTFNNNI